MLVEMANAAIVNNAASPAIKSEADMRAVLRAIFVRFPTITVDEVVDVLRRGSTLEFDAGDYVNYSLPTIMKWFEATANQYLWFYKAKFGERFILALVKADGDKVIARARLWAKQGFVTKTTAPPYILAGYSREDDMPLEYSELIDRKNYQSVVVNDTEYKSEDLWQTSQ